jgi:hypothetical protein
MATLCGYAQVPSGSDEEQQPKKKGKQQVPAGGKLGEKGKETTKVGEATYL